MELKTLFWVIVISYWLGYRIPVIIYKKFQAHLVKRKRLVLVGELPLLISLIFYGYFAYYLATNPLSVGNTFVGLAITLFIFSAVFNEWGRVVLGKQWSSAARILKKHRLVQEGPYSLVRHPMYFANLLMMVSGLVIVRAWLMLLLFLANFLVLLYRIKVEEEELSKTFKEEYRNYQKRAKKLIPFIW